MLAPVTGFTADSSADQVDSLRRQGLPDDAAYVVGAKNDRRDPRRLCLVLFRRRLGSRLFGHLRRGLLFLTLARFLGQIQNVRVTGLRVDIAHHQGDIVINNPLPHHRFHVTGGG